MDTLIKILLGILAVIAGLYLYEKSRNKKLQQENAVLKTNNELKEGIFKFEEGKKDANASEERYHKSADEFNKLYGDGPK